MINKANEIDSGLLNAALFAYQLIEVVGSK